MELKGAFPSDTFFGTTGFLKSPYVPGPTAGLGAFFLSNLEEVLPKNWSLCGTGLLLKLEACSGLK
jgi:hypothetical protein